MSAAQQITNHEEILAAVAGGKHTVERIAQELYVSPSTVHRYAKDLVERGWLTVQLTARQQGRRRITSNAYVLTERGTEAVATNEAW